MVSNEQTENRGWQDSSREDMAATLPMVEVFETVEGEGTMAGYPTTFVRVFHCNLRCIWCDTKYSYAPARPAYYASVQEIADQVLEFQNSHVCLTGGEPLLHGQKSQALVRQLANLPVVRDLHVETNGAVDLRPFDRLRESEANCKGKLRFIMDYKLPGSGEEAAMKRTNFEVLREHDEIKFVIADSRDFERAKEVIEEYVQRGQVLLSPVFSSVSPKQLVEWTLASKMKSVRINLQLHKFIWDPEMRGV
jgi:7-carboxy-7-deazaguanine synthase